VTGIGRCALVVGLLLPSLAGATPQQAAERTARPNFVLVLVDDQGWTGTSVRMDPAIPESSSDYYRTPNLERLAAAGMRFSSAYAPAPNCSPSRCSILTGMGPAHTGMTDLWNRKGERVNAPWIGGLNVNAIDPEAVTLPECLKQIDPAYRTAHFGKWHLGSGGPAKHGFDVGDGLTSNVTGNARIADDPKRIFSVTERSVAFLQERAADGEPFFLQVSHYAPHKGTEALAETIARCAARPRGQRHDAPDYAAMIEDLDTGLGILLQALDDLDLAANTYVIYYSDNGAGHVAGVTNNLPLSSGKTSLREGGLRVPLVVRGPGIEAGTTSRTRVVGYDLYPTICDLAGGGGAVPADLDGGSMKDLLLGGGTGAVRRSRDFLVFHFPHYQIAKGLVPESAIYRGPWKLTKHWPDGTRELYAIDDDLSESNDLAEGSPGVAAELDALLEAYLEGVHAPMPRPNPDWDAAQQATFDAAFGADEDADDE